MFCTWGSTRDRTGGLTCVSRCFCPWTPPGPSPLPFFTRFISFQPLPSLSHLPRIISFYLCLLFLWSHHTQLVTRSHCKYMLVCPALRFQSANYLAIRIFIVLIYFLDDLRFHNYGPKKSTLQLQPIWTKPWSTLSNYFTLVVTWWNMVHSGFDFFVFLPHPAMLRSYHLLALNSEKNLG